MRLYSSLQHLFMDMPHFLTMCRHKKTRALYWRTKSFLRKSRPPFVFLFGSPFHSNLGDQAQTHCILGWIKQHLPRHEVFISTYMNSSAAVLKLIRQHIRKNDILLCHSGYHMTDLYDEQTPYLRVAELFPDYPLTIFPQTVHYQDEANALATADVLNHHPNCTLLCRDEHSYATAKTLFHQCRLLLYPDIVTSLIGKTQLPEHPRKGVLFCMRDDKEAFYSPQSIRQLREELNVFSSTAQTDTTVNIPAEEVMKLRDKILRDTFDYFSRFQVIVTDRYHGTIFCLIANTPVIVLQSSDHKLASGLQWFPESFRTHVHFAETLEQVPAMVQEILAQKQALPLPDYFSAKYYDHLLEQLNFPV